MSKLKFIPLPVLCGLCFMFGCVFSFVFPFEQSKKTHECHIANKQWVLNLGSSWFRLIEKNNQKNPSLFFVKTEQKDILCRYPVSALRLYPSKTSVSIDVFMPKIHDKMMSLIMRGDHKNHQFVLDTQAQDLPLCDFGPEIAYGRVR